MEFNEVIRDRRSCRKYTKDEVPTEVIETALSHALIAPTSSNMQLWKFVWVHSEEKKKALAAACFGQSAASTAKELIVVVADWSFWKENRKRMLESLKQRGSHPAVIKYYEKLVPLMYNYGFLNIPGLFKKILATLKGFWGPVPRSPFTRNDLSIVAIKSAALACENFMLSIYNQGYACCPMEGFDEHRVNKIIENPSKDSRITMIISVGKADAAGIIGSQLRFDKELFIHKI